MSETVTSDQVPTAVKDALAEKFPDAKVETWEYTAEFEADITVDGVEIEITFDQHGEILQIEREMNPDDLPQAVKDALANDFPTATIEEAELVEIPSAKLEFFEVELDEDGEMVELHIQHNGTIIDVDEDL